ncbi:TfoX/Sxy family protein, partial [Burkholderia multivorans]|uniref:TfoX/Sxy family protein n=1 Tax=Burkholderia multivorans TaxID=87883 RepID=UPI000DAF59F2
MNWQAEKARGEEIAYQLSGLSAVTVTRLFGGAALRLDGVMFGFVARGSLFLRVDDVNRPAFVAAGMGPF